jgi:hypothetical protein
VTDGGAAGARAVRFEAVLEPEGTGTYVIVPDDVADAMGARGRTSVAGTIDGRPFRNQVMPYRDDSPNGRRWYMVVNRTVRAEIGKGAGEPVALVLARDDDRRSPPR